MSSFFLHFPLVRFNNQLFVFAKMTEKGKSFFSVLVPETNNWRPDTQVFVYDRWQEKRVTLKLYFLAVYVDHGVGGRGEGGI